MKLKLIILFLGMMPILFTSCGKDKNCSGDNEGDVFTVELDGDKYCSGLVNTVYPSITKIMTITATGVSLDPELFTILVLEPSVGTFAFDNTNTISYGPSLLDASNQYQSENGSITISVFDTLEKRISGTFNGTFQNLLDSTTIEFTNGIFDASYIE